jgi:glutathione peroxidase
MIFGFPCNQFKGQEPLNGMDILKHYKDEFNVSFPISMKIEVNGPNTEPLYQFLKEKAPYNGFGSFKEKAVLYPILKSSYPEYLKENELRWNYTKFLVAKGGEIIERFEPSVKPEKIEGRIKELLGL